MQGISGLFGMPAKAGIQCPSVDGSSLQINLKDVSGVLANAKKKSNKSSRFHRLVKAQAAVHSKIT